MRQVMTAPCRPEPPVVVRCEQRSVVVKWYPGSPGGTHKYRLQARLVEGLDGIGTTNTNNNTATATDRNRAGTAATCSAAGDGGGGGRKRRAAWGPVGDSVGGGGGGGGEWVTVYEGVDSTAKVATGCHRGGMRNPLLFNFSGLDRARACVPQRSARQRVGHNPFFLFVASPGARHDRSQGWR